MSEGFLGGRIHLGTSPIDTQPGLPAVDGGIADASLARKKRSGGRLLAATAALSLAACGYQGTSVQTKSSNPDLRLVAISTAGATRAAHFGESFWEVGNTGELLRCKHSLDKDKRANPAEQCDIFP